MNIIPLDQNQIYKSLERMPYSMLDKYSLKREDTFKFFDRTFKHISNVQNVYDRIRSNLLESVIDVSELEQSRLDYLIKNHDYSKFLPENIIGYIWINKYYQNRSPYPCPEVKGLADLAWFNHYVEEDHHPDYWKHHSSLKEMPVSAIIHMVCDWEAMSMELGGTTQHYFDSNNLKYDLSTQQVRNVQQVINLL